MLNTMNPSLLFAQLSLGSWGLAAIAVVGLVTVVVVFGAVWASRYTKVGPNQVLVVSGRRYQFRDADGTVCSRGFRIVKGGGTFVWPVIEKIDTLSLELLTIDVQTPEVYTSKGVPVKVDGVAQTKVKGDDISIGTAAEQFLSKGTEEIKNIAMQTLEGHLRAILGTMTVEEIYQNRDAFASKVQEVAAGRHGEHGAADRELHHPGHPGHPGLPRRLGKPRIAQVKRDAQIAQAEADRDAMIKSAQAHAGGTWRPSSPPTPRWLKRNRDYELKVAEYNGSTVNHQEGRGRLRLRTSEIQDRAVGEGRGGAGTDHREAEADRASAAGNPAPAARVRGEHSEAGGRRAVQGGGAGERPVSNWRPRRRARRRPRSKPVLRRPR
jgi:flotillin